MANNEEFSGQLRSPGGFVFGVQGWSWGDPKPTSITFFLDNTCKVSDQHGRPIKGTLVDNKEVRFADTAPIADHGGAVIPRPQFATHEQVIAALAEERVDWQKLVTAGWPQLRYEALKALKAIPSTPIEELKKIRDAQLRRDALKLRRELEDDRDKESAATAEE